MQLLEDYKRGTLRPGVTNEQVTLLEVGWGMVGGKEGGKLTIPPPQPEPLLFPSESTSTAAPFPWTSGFWRGYSGISCKLVWWEVWRLLRLEKPKAIV